MGTSPKGKLVYGYHLGDTEEGWLIQELTEDDAWDVPWLANPAEADSDDIFTGLQERLVTHVAGFTEPDPWPDTYRDHDDDSPERREHHDWYHRRSQAERALRVKLESHGYPDFSGHLLATHVIEAEWGEVLPVDLTALEAKRVTEGWDAALAEAIKALQITPIEVVGGQVRWDRNATRVPVPPRWMVVTEYS